MTITAAQAGTPLIDAPEGRSLHLAGCVIAASAANTNTPAVTIRLGDQSVFSHPGVPAGGGLAVSGFDVSTASGDDVTIDCGDPGGALTVMVAYGA